MSHLNLADKYKGQLPELQFIGTNSNAFSLLSRWRDAAKLAEWTRGDIDAVLEHARSAGYEHLLATLMTHSEPDTLAGEEVDR
jgi:hypothetical protein